MNKKIKILLIIMLGQFYFSCSEHLNTGNEFMQWINDPDNGLLKRKTVGDIMLSVKYLPAEYLVFRELRSKISCTKAEYDSIYDAYRHTRTFILNIAPSGDDSLSDIMFSGVENYSEYTVRSLEMNFEMSDYIKLTTNNVDYFPKLANLENVYGLKNSRNLYLVFTPDKNKEDLFTSDSLDLVFEDPFFNTGISHFNFKTEQTDKIPELDFLKKYKL